MLNRMLGFLRTHMESADLGKVVIVADFIPKGIPPTGSQTTPYASKTKRAASKTKRAASKAKPDAPKAKPDASKAKPDASKAKPELSQPVEAVFPHRYDWSGAFGMDTASIRSRAADGRRSSLQIGGTRTC